MKFFKRTAVAIFIIIACVDNSIAEEKELSSLDFLNATRYPRGETSWARMSGKITNFKKLKNGERKQEEHPIFVAIRFTQVATIGQVVIPNKEGYSIGQFYSKDNRTTTLNDMEGSKRDIFPRFGIDPRDLTMSFLFWDFQEELAKESVRGKDCRVFILKNFDKEKSEKVKVYISAEYAFPMKAEWIKNDSKDYYRSLEAKSFSKDSESGFWLVDVIKIEGKSSRTMIEFDKIEADFEPKEPKDLYKTSIEIKLQ